jgi:thiosulfate/3-mercaptopyruvate sulfurtransferase
MNGSTLVSTGELEKNLTHWRVFDCRHELAKPELGEQQYREGHIPGALFAHLERDLSGRKTGRNGRHPLPEPQDFEKWLEKAGLTPKDQVVCYDAGPGAMAARLWWMLRWIGHESVAVLDGGLAKWTKEGRPVSIDVPLFTRLNYPIKARPEYAIDVRTVEKLFSKSLLLDARAPARWRGEHEPIDPVAGRIPGAKNR